MKKHVWIVASLIFISVYVSAKEKPKPMPVEFDVITAQSSSVAGNIIGVLAVGVAVGGDAHMRVRLDDGSEHVLVGETKLKIGHYSGVWNKKHNGIVIETDREDKRNTGKKEKEICKSNPFELKSD